MLFLHLLAYFCGLKIMQTSRRVYLLAQGAINEVFSCIEDFLPTQGRSFSVLEEIEIVEIKIENN